MNIVSIKRIIGEIEKKGGRIWKARLVAWGFTEKFGNKFECKTPTCSAEGLKLVLAVIKTYRRRMRTLDIKTAYLQGREIMREVYIRPPKEAKTGKVWQLKKTVYGLKDAAKHWYKSLMGFLKETGGRGGSAVDELYGIMGTHVDDLWMMDKEIIALSSGRKDG